MAVSRSEFIHLPKDVIVIILSYLQSDFESLRFVCKILQLLCDTLSQKTLADNQTFFALSPEVDSKKASVAKKIFLFEKKDAAEFFKLHNSPELSLATNYSLFKITTRGKKQALTKIYEHSSQVKGPLNKITFFVTNPQEIHFEDAEPKDKSSFHCTIV